MKNKRFFTVDRNSWLSATPDAVSGDADRSGRRHAAKPQNCNFFVQGGPGNP